MGRKYKKNGEVSTSSKSVESSVMIVVSNGTLNEEVTCRICMLPEDVSSPESAVIKPCSCTGAVSSVHFECVKSWIRTSGRLVCCVCQSDYAGIKTEGSKRVFVDWVKSTSRFERELILVTSLMTTHLLIYSSSLTFSSTPDQLGFSSTPHRLGFSSHHLDQDL